MVLVKMMKLEAYGAAVVKFSPAMDSSGVDLMIHQRLETAQV